MAAITIAIVGVGKIAQDQHLPVIAGNPDFALAALVSGRGVDHASVPTFRTQAELLQAMPNVEAVAICTPPSVRYALAREALDAGKHVLLEKPPAQTVTELTDLAAYAASRGRVVFTTWHSQYNDGVDTLKARLAGRRIRKLTITWKEDVRRWHPKQDWIWTVGGFGIFDPGINALSILTKIMPGPVFVRSADLTFPSNRDMPIAADLVFTSPVATGDAALTAAFDWRQTGEQTWAIDVETAEGEVFHLTAGGSKLALNGQVLVEAPPAEYQGIYRHFAELVRAGTSAVDSAPFQLVADAFMVGRRIVTEPFED